MRGRLIFMWILDSDQRNGALQVLTVVAFGAVVVLGCGVEERPRRELHANAVIVVIDALRADTVSNNDHEPETPALDRIAAEGARFESAFAPSSSAFPSLVTLHTALPPEQHGVVREPLALGDDALTLAEVLRDNGFDTAAFVAGPGFEKARGLAQGFATYVERSESSTTRAMDWLSAWHRRQDDMPFLLYVQLPMFDGSTAGEPDAEIAAYERSIQESDHQVGRLFERLDELGLSDETLLIVTSSRGYEFGKSQPRGVGHSLHNHGVHVPLLVHMPGEIEAGKVIRERARTMDIASTVLMMTRVPTPPEFGFTHTARGFSMRDLAEMLIGEPRDFEVAVTGDLADNAQSYRMDPYKLVRHLPRPGSDRVEETFELFDIEADPLETRNIFETEQKRARVLIKKLDAWREICAARPRYAVLNVGRRY